jgi:hypothetical protein
MAVSCPLRRFNPKLARTLKKHLILECETRPGNPFVSRLHALSFSAGFLNVVCSLSEVNWRIIFVFAKFSESFESAG